ncbi:scale keratin-like [Limosa lapponica baueri]|uniref:Keratin n=1 Tax=Limosa lapponica baueri TaxID=1758121 RepID=A0A2I0TA64_LIMLA|nr:scale keratin-like [Limosa lapponica baueri]
MSCYDLCPPKTSVAVPQPIAESCNDLCTRQCPDSSAFIQPPPVVVTFPGPILSSFPQQAPRSGTSSTRFHCPFSYLYDFKAPLGYGISAISMLSRGYCSPYSSHQYSQFLLSSLSHAKGIRTIAG